MNKKFKRNLINILLFLGLMFYIFLLSSCGPSKEEIEAKEKERADSITKATIVKPKAITNETVYYHAADFGLVPGTVLRWAPQDNDEAAQYFKDGKTVYIHIIQDDGKIVVLPSSEYVWLNLYQNNVLK